MSCRNNICSMWQDVLSKDEATAGTHVHTQAQLARGEGSEGPAAALAPAA